MHKLSLSSPLQLNSGSSLGAALQPQTHQTLRKSLWVSRENRVQTLCKKSADYPQLAGVLRSLGTTSRFTHTLHKLFAQNYPQANFQFQSVNLALSTVSTQLNKWFYKS